MVEVCGQKGYIYSASPTVLGHKSERKPYSTLPERLSDFRRVTVSWIKRSSSVSPEPTKGHAPVMWWSGPV